MCIRDSIKTVQEQTFSIDLEKIRRKNAVREHSPLISLSPIFYENGILRALKNSELSYDETRPMTVKACFHHSFNS